MRMHTMHSSCEKSRERVVHVTFSLLSSDVKAVRVTLSLHRNRYFCGKLCNDN